MNKKISIIISSLNEETELRRLLALLHNEVAYPLQPEIIVMDLGSRDGSLELLRSVKGIRWESLAGSSLGAAFNAGASLATGDYLLFLHSDTVPTRQCFTVMFEELAAAPKAAAIGPFANRSRNLSLQGLTSNPMHSYEDVCGLADYLAEKDTPPVSSLWLDDFCLLIRQEAFQKAGGFDESFPGHGSEDIDLSLRLREAGYSLLASRRAYAHHARTSIPAVDTEGDSRKHFQAKWHFDPSYSLNARNDLLPWLDGLKGHVAVLEIGCACGPTLLAVKDRLPEAQLYGVELDEAPARIAASFAQVEACDIEGLSKSEWRERFDCIICGDVIEHLRSPEAALQNIHHYLKPGGRLLLSVPNIMHVSIFNHLLHGRFPYGDSGLLDRTHTKFFTNREICRLVQAAGFSIETEDSLNMPLSAEDEELCQKLTPLLAQGVSQEELRIYQIHLKCIRV